MRRVLVLVFILVLVIAAAPFGMGILAERQLNRIVDNASHTSNLKISISDYQRGWLSSDADFTVSFMPPEQLFNATAMKAPKMDFTVKQHIFHGPIIFTHKGFRVGQAWMEHKLDLSDDSKSAFNMLFADQPVKPSASSETLVALTGHTTINFDIPAYHYASEAEQTEANWLGLHAHWTISSNLSQIDNVFAVKGLNLKTNDNYFEMGQLDFHFTNKENAQGLWLGNASLVFPHLKANMGENVKMSIEGIHFDTKTDMSGEVVNMNVSAKLNNLTFNGDSYGPCELLTSLNNLDASSLAQIQNQLREFNHPDLTMEQRKSLLIQLLPQLPGLLAKGARYELTKLHIHLPQGDVDAEGHVGLTKSDKPIDFMFPQIIQQINAALNVKAPIAVVRKLYAASLKDKLREDPSMQSVLAQQLKQAQSQKPGEAPTQTTQKLNDSEITILAEQAAEKQLAAVTENKLLLKDGGLYKINITFNNGVLTVNGKQMLSEIFNLMNKK